MTDSLLQRLAGAKLRETSGSRSADRLAFQKDWALCLLLKLHSERDEYVVLFDYIDDVVVLDSPVTATKAEFYQIKTKRSGDFTLAQLLDRPKAKDGASLSILGKLVDDQLRFPSETRSLSVVANVPFGVQLGSGAKSTDMTPICLNDLTAASVERVLKQMMEEHGLDKQPDVQDITFFVVTDLSLLGHAEHARGKLNDFLQSLFPDRPLPVTAVYRALFGEIQRRNDKLLSSPTPEELLKQKAIAKSDLDEMIRSLPPDTGVKQRLAFVWDQLRHEGAAYTDIEDLQRAVQRYELKKTDKTNRPLNKVVRAAKASLRDLTTEHRPYATLCEKLKVVVQEVRRQVPESLSVFSDQEIKGIIIFEDNNE